ncbi:MICOS complex subunit Mic19 [Macrosteles quadrilineatus]|uniref:MICOS complex subunit Mic19 n=1 Tax=Macrosteles quadrilineatus TaxID=74068 RepID=UPI0023E1A067|nr:MICOS complex subunit Mic19 [Macrosteles quadrilineatus]
MGGGQSTRKIQIDNDEPVGIIKASENVVQRLKSTNGGGSNIGASSNYTQPSSPDKMSNNSQNQSHQVPAYIPQPYVTSSMVREQVEKELEKNDRYWESRIRGLQENQNKLSYIMESEFNKAYKEVGKNFPVIAPKSVVMPCQDIKTKLVDCFKNNANQTLNCSKIVNEFTSCVSNSRPKNHSEVRSP